MVYCVQLIEVLSVRYVSVCTEHQILFLLVRTDTLCMVHQDPIRTGTAFTIQKGTRYNVLQYPFRMVRLLRSLRFSY